MPKIGMTTEASAAKLPRPLLAFRLGAMTILIANVILDQVGFFLAEKYLGALQ